MCNSGGDCAGTHPGYSAGVPTQCRVQPMQQNCPRANACSCCSGGYMQPPRAEMFKPISNYCRPTAPMECNTVYRRSYYGNGCADRVHPFIPGSTLTTPNCPLETTTIQKLSYQGHCGVKPTEPIRPQQRNLGNLGPMQTVTTQKHDFVPKPICRTQPFLPQNSIDKTCASLERHTVNRLSYQPIDVCQNPPPQAIRPQGNCMRATGPSDNLTIQKLSFQPICTPPKEDFPWGKNLHIEPPPYPCQHTTYGLSYLPNCQPERTKPIIPCQSGGFLGGDIPKPCTVYKLSYQCAPTERVGLIVPQGTIGRPCAPLEKNTIYKLSFLGSCEPRTQPIRPHGNTMRSNEPLQKITTQMHDFVPKPICRTQPIRPMGSIARPCGPLESNTVNRLSFMPIDTCKFRPPEPFRPIENQQKGLGPISNCTTYKLSYMPTCPQPREPLPWATHSNYTKPTAPLETCTIQKLSYMPPGAIYSQNCGPCSCKQMDGCGQFPRAGIC